METIADLLESIPDSDRPLLVSDSNTYTASRFRRMIYKTANLLRYRGVHEGESVVIADVRAPQSIFSFLGAGLLGGVVGFGLDTEDEPGTVIGPTSEIEGREFPESTTLVGFETEPEEARIAFYEREIWSETAHLPPTDLDPNSRIFDESNTWTQDEVMSVAIDLAERFGPRSVTALREPLQTEGTPIAGILSPLLADATILFPTADKTGTVAVSSDPAPEPDRIDPTTVHP